MEPESKQSHEPCEARFRCLDINRLERCELSAKEAKYSNITRLNTSRLCTKVLYEIKFPPALRGETRYLKGPRIFQHRIFPEFLVTTQRTTRYYSRKLDVGPQLVVAVRVDIADASPFVDPKKRLEHYLERWNFLSSTNFENPLYFWSDHIYVWHDRWACPGVLSDKEFWRDKSIEIADCSRLANNLRIQAIVKHMLGAELDSIEFQLQYYGRTTDKLDDFSGWATFARVEAQSDVAEALTAGAKEALAARKHYACRAEIRKAVERRSVQPICVLPGHYPHPGWYVHGTRPLRSSRDWAGKPPDPPAKVRGRSVMNGLDICDELELENKSVVDHEHKHNRFLNESKSKLSSG